MSFHKRSAGRVAFDIFNVTLMLVMAFAFIAPLWHVVMSSISDPMQVVVNTGLILRPLGEINWGGYNAIFASGSGILVGYRNTIFYTVSAVSFGTFMTILAGYGLSRRGLMWGNFIMFYLAFTMLFGGGLIPFFMVVRSLRMLNTPWAIIIPGAVSVFNIIIMRTAFSGLPESLEESAKIDGAGHMTIMWRIMVPLAKSSIAVIVLFYAVGQWNSWFNASIFLRDRNLFPLQLFMREVLLRNDPTAVLSAAEAAQLADFAHVLVRYATVVAGTLPLLFFYPFAQKHFVTGVMIGSIKG